MATELDVSAGAPVTIEGTGATGLARYPAIAGAAYALVVDETRKRFLVGGPGQITEVLPPLPATVDDQLFPAAASIGGRNGSRWATQTVAWNRGTADTAGATVDATVNVRLLPTDWIVGFSPTTTLTVGPGKLVSQDDPIGTDMGGTDTAGALRFTTGATATKFADFYSWIRVYRTREDGGTYGFARNFVKGGQGIGTGETGVLLTPHDAGSQRTNAGLFVVEGGTGTVSIVDASGTLVGGPFAYDWPAGYQVQASTIFDAFGIPPSAVGSRRLLRDDGTGPSVRDRHRLGLGRSGRPAVLRPEEHGAVPVDPRRRTGRRAARPELPHGSAALQRGRGRLHGLDRLPRGAPRVGRRARRLRLLP